VAAAELPSMMKRGRRGSMKKYVRLPLPLLRGTPSKGLALSDPLSVGLAFGEHPAGASVDFFAYPL
jgi:hypothetical protein